MGSPTAVREWDRKEDRDGTSCPSWVHSQPRHEPIDFFLGLQHGKKIKMPVFVMQSGFRL
jgi:hypothetical protein